MPDSTTLDRAKKILAVGNFSCVACKGETVFISEEHGIGSLLSWIDGKDDLAGAAVADKVIGKAAALLLVLLDVSQAHTPVLSERAFDVLKRHHIAVTYGKVVPYIKNRTGDGICPMEETVWDIDDPKEALEAIRQRRVELQRLSR